MQKPVVKDMDAVEHLTNKLLEESRKNGNLENTVKELKGKVAELEEELKQKSRDAETYANRAKDAEIALLLWQKELNACNINRNIHFAGSTVRHLNMFLNKVQEDDSEVFDLLKPVDVQWNEILRNLPLILAEKNAEFDRQIDEIRKGTALSTLERIQASKIPPPPQIHRKVIEKLNSLPGLDGKVITASYLNGEECGYARKQYTQNIAPPGFEEASSSSVPKNIEAFQNHLFDYMIRMEFPDMTKEEFMDLFHAETANQRNLSVTDIAKRMIEAAKRQKSAQESSSNLNECPVCLNYIDDKCAAVRCPECGKPYHKACLYSWLRKNSSCPQCGCSLMTPD